MDGGRRVMWAVALLAAAVRLPGVYTQALQGGIRLEDNYVVREDGLENLFDFPMHL